MVFKCRCCNQIVDEKPRFVAGLSEFACNAEWLDVGEPLPPLEERFWLHADALPKAGERRIIKVGYYTPFAGEIGECAELEFTWGNWEYYSFDAQGDCGDWRLIFTDENGVRHLILQCDRGRHGGFVLFGNAVC